MPYYQCSKCLRPFHINTRILNSPALYYKKLCFGCWLRWNTKQEKALKLFYCPQCEDVVRLIQTTRRCLCEASEGFYREDGIHAVLSGQAIPLGFDNVDFLRAIREQPAQGAGELFDAFVISDNCPTVHYSQGDDDGSLSSRKSLG